MARKNCFLAVKRYNTGMRKWIAFCVGLLLPAVALADTLLWTDQGYKRGAVNDRGEVLLLTYEAAEENGLVVDVNAGVTLLDRKDKELWRVLVGGDGSDTLYQAVPAKDGWLAVGGSSSGDLANGWHEGFYDAFEPKLDALVVRLGDDGGVLWTRCYGGGDTDVFRGVCEAEGGGYILVGHTYSSDGDVMSWHDSGETFIQPDGWIVCIDEGGEILWQRTLGGSGQDALYGVVPVEGGYLAVGATDSQDGDVSANNGDLDGWAVLVSGEGELLASRCYGGNSEDVLTAVAAGPDGLLAIGYTWSWDNVETFLGCDGWALGLTGEGELRFAQRFGAEGTQRAQIALWRSGAWTVTGYTQLDGDGVREWAITLPKGGQSWKVIRGEM